MKTIEGNKCEFECIRTNVERVCVKPKKGTCPRCEQLARESLDRIQQLEAELAEAKRERDALANDLKAACKLLWSDDSDRCCEFCEHENKSKETGYCDKCFNGNCFKFKPAALCPENTEVQDGKVD